MKDKDLINSLEPEDLQGSLNICANVIGVPNIIKLTEAIPGQRVSIPKQGDMLKGVRKRRIIAEYEKGDCSMQYLADKYEVSKKTVYNYIKHKDKGKP